MREISFFRLVISCTCSSLSSVSTSPMRLCVNAKTPLKRANARPPAHCHHIVPGSTSIHAPTPVKMIQLSIWLGCKFCEEPVSDEVALDVTDVATDAPVTGYFCVDPAFCTVSTFGPP